jgi:hypothetical protein
MHKVAIEPTATIKKLDECLRYVYTNKIHVSYVRLLTPRTYPRAVVVPRVIACASLFFMQHMTCGRTLLGGVMVEPQAKMARISRSRGRPALCFIAE